MGSFRDLDVYRRSCALANAVALAVQGWEKESFWTCGVQLIRAADSIGANISEAHGRDTLRDRRRQIYLARGSAFELEHWLDLAAARGLPIPGHARVEAQEISRMLTGLARHLSPRN